MEQRCPAWRQRRQPLAAGMAAAVALRDLEVAAAAATQTVRVLVLALSQALGGIPTAAAAAVVLLSCQAAALEQRRSLWCNFRKIRQQQYGWLM